MKRVLQKEAEKRGCTYCEDNIISGIDELHEETKIVADAQDDIKKTISDLGKRIRKIAERDQGGVEPGKKKRYSKCVCTYDSCPYHELDGIKDYEEECKAWERKIKEAAKKASEKQKKAGFSR